ncbi:MAG: hypothetical protein M3R50_11455, partial [Bacteroidota bacterium]|nr:hypothetical protein [Bacteroidota bacterium]
MQPTPLFRKSSITLPTRLGEISTIYKEILSKPFDFTKNESLQLDGDKRNYPTTEA